MPNRIKRSLVAAILFLLPACGFGIAVSQGTIVLQTQFPVQNEETRILVHTSDGNPIAGARVVATYRPGSRVQADSTIGFTDAGGAVDWIPSEAGIVAISAQYSGADGSDIQLQTNISVKFSSTPLSGVLIMLVAGTLLIGGSVVRFTRYLRGQGF